MRACLLHPVTSEARKDRNPELALAEAESLVAALDLDLVQSDVVMLQKTHPGKFFGTGKAEELGRKVQELEADLVVINAQVSPIQQRNLEAAWKTKVLDRTALILEIFGDRARTREGVLQVDLAHLTYQKSRLVRSWTHLERQRGGSGFMGGPGETQIEADRRAIDNAIIRLRRQLEKVVKTRALHRASRKKIPYPIVALVGYTNAGKSTIFNAMTGASVMARDQVFATLDPTMRLVQLASGRDVILSDTVGFISDLPTQLIAAFRATLEEVLDADLILHIRDIAHPETEMQARNVASILAELGVKASPGDGMIEVWNKIDLLDEDKRRGLSGLMARQEDHVAVSAVTGAGLDDLMAAIDRFLTGEVEHDRLDLDLAAGDARAWLYAENVVTKEDAEAGRLLFDVTWTQAQKGRFLSRHGHEARLIDAS